MVKRPCKIFSVFRISSLVKYCAFRVRHQNLLSVMYAVFGFQKKIRFSWSFSLALFKSQNWPLFHNISYYYPSFNPSKFHSVPAKKFASPPEVSLLLYLILYPISDKCLILYRNQNQITGFYMKCNTGLKWVNANLLYNWILNARWIDAGLCDTSGWNN